MRVLQAGALYFACVFATGFVMGTIRVFWIVPSLGVRTTELAEVPVMLAVTIVAARAIADKLRVAHRMAARAAMGLVALGLLLVAEWMIVTGIRGLTIGQYVRTRDPVGASAYLAMLVLITAMPLAVMRDQN